MCEGGVIILSRFEIDSWEFMPFSYSIDGEGQSVIGVVQARIKVPAVIKGHKPSDFRYLNLFNVHTQSSSSYSDPYILMESLKCRQTHIEELSDFVDLKTKQSDPLTELVLICGDFNVNGLPESLDVQNMILKAHPDNRVYLEAASKEYSQLVKKLERSRPGSIVDLAMEHLGEHPKTYLHFNTCRELNKREEFQIEINQCYDYIF